MLLSLRSNPQTMKPYIQEMMVCAPGQSITCSIAYCSTYSSPFVSIIVITSPYKGLSLLCSRIDVHLWVIDQCHAKPWGPCISTGSYCPKIYLWLSEVYWRELPCAYESKHLHLVVLEISADQCLALINWYLNEYWLLWHILGIVRKVFHGNHVSIREVMAEWSLWYYPPSWFELYWEVILFLVYSEGTPAAFCLYFVSFL